MGGGRKGRRRRRRRKKKEKKQKKNRRSLITESPAMKSFAIKFAISMFLSERKRKFVFVFTLIR